LAAGAAHVLALSKTWSVVLMLAAFCLPPAIIGWLKTRRHRLS
jgi:hypothetical protein